ncbi:hypothetical protein B0H13DRAFT_1872905 [Mycena leptocephala]|nr:hypothetical protein B0H13DRAFT_1872905 [Mycena leptocephala]
MVETKDGAKVPERREPGGSSGADAGGVQYGSRTEREVRDQEGDAKASVPPHQSGEPEARSTSTSAKRVRGRGEGQANTRSAKMAREGRGKAGARGVEGVRMRAAKAAHTGQRRGANQGCAAGRTVDCM